MNSSRRLLTFAAFTWPGLMVGQPVLSLTSASGPIGTPIATSLSISGTTASKGPSALHFALGFQSADFSSVTVAAGPVAAGASKSISCNSAAGRVRCVLWRMNKKALRNGVLATVTAVPSATSSKSSRSISIGEATSAAMGGAPVPVNAGTGGAIQVIEECRDFVRLSIAVGVLENQELVPDRAGGCALRVTRPGGHP